MINIRFSPTHIPRTPSSNPWMTWPTPTWNLNGSFLLHEKKELKNTTFNKRQKYNFISLVLRNSKNLGQKPREIKYVIQIQFHKVFLFSTNKFVKLIHFI